jgi:hypothetical protein
MLQRTLDMLAELADRRGVSLSLTVSPYDDATGARRRLVSIGSFTYDFSSTSSSYEEGLYNALVTAEVHFRLEDGRKAF